MQRKSQLQRKQRGKEETMNYTSTRGDKGVYTASQAVLQGLAPDGGLFVPDTFPVLPCKVEELKGKSYQEIAYLVMKQFLDDYT